MKYGSLFTGIGGFDKGFDDAGMECAWQVEQNPNCLRILGRHWPGVPKLIDVREVNEKTVEPVDLICGGFPCQDLSIAGRRAGLSGERSGLWFEFYRIIKSLKPGWVVIENVPGLLSSNGGQDFTVILRGLVECGYGVCWRILDAQFFGVPQRRRRVFIVGSLGNGSSAQVLFESEGLHGNPPSRQKARKEIAANIAACLRSKGARTGTRIDAETGLVVQPGFGEPDGIARALTSCRTATGRLDPNEQTLIAATLNSGGNVGGGDCRLDISSERVGSLPIVQTPAIAWHENKEGVKTPSLIAKALRSNASHSYQGVGVRRLTPTECEKLQGFPDKHTIGESDSSRYRMLGNAVAVPVAKWIGKRIMKVSQTRAAK